MNSIINHVNNFVRAHIFGFGVLFVFAMFFLLAGGFVMANSQVVLPNDSHVVNLYMDGKTTTIPTRATTVGEFLSRANIKTHQADLIEPGVKTAIDADNFTIQIYKARPVTIVDKDKTSRVLSPYKDPKTIIQKAKIKIDPEDQLVLTTATNFVQENIFGEKLIINRATPVTMSLYGSPPLAYKTQSKTVKEFLKEKKVKLEPGASVIPSNETTINDNMAIFVSKAGKTVVIAEETIPFGTDNKLDLNKPVGYKQLLQKGIEGKKQVIYEVDTNNPANKRVIQEVVILQPQNQQMIVGSKTAAFGGDFAAALARLRSCEGAYTSNTGNGYYGAYQFNLGSWRANAPAGYENMLPSQAPPAVQDQAAATYYKKSGWRPWPSCSRSLGLLDIYR